MLRSNAYIVVKGTVTVNKKTFTADDFEALNNTAANATATNTANNNGFGEKSQFLKTMLNLSIVFQKLMEQKLIMQNNHLDVVIPMYNLLEYSKNYRNFDVQ